MSQVTHLENYDRHLRQRSPFQTSWTFCGLSCKLMYSDGESPLMNRLAPTPGTRWWAVYGPSAVIGLQKQHRSLFSPNFTHCWPIKPPMHAKKPFSEMFSTTLHGRHHGLRLEHKHPTGDGWQFAAGLLIGAAKPNINCEINWDSLNV